MSVTYLTAPSVASFEFGQWHARASHRGLASTVVALLLALHWAAPSPQPVEVHLPSQNSRPGLSSHRSIDQHGTLPRALPRALVFESFQSKSQRQDLGGGRKLDALHASIRGVPPAIEDLPAAPAAVAAPASTPALAFNARAPPVTV